MNFKSFFVLLFLFMFIIVGFQTEGNAFVGVVRGAKIASKAAKAAKNSKKVKNLVKTLKNKRLSDKLLLGKEGKAKNIQNITDITKAIKKGNISGERLKFLGKNFIKVGKGKWRNLKGTKQFRVKPNDYLGKHPAKTSPKYIGPHAHYEYLKLNKKKKKLDVYKNVHVPLAGFDY